MEKIPEETKSTKKAKVSVWVPVLFFCSFLAWGYVYLFIFRPIMNEWLSQYISGYPAILHVVPVVFLPVFLLIGVGRLLEPKNGKRDTNS